MKSQMLRALCATTLVVSASFLGGCSAIEGLLGSSTAARDAETQEVTEAGDADVFSLRVGDCYNDTSGESISDVPAVKCSDPHDNEIYFTFVMPAGEWPGDEAITAAAEEQCGAQFDIFVGLPYAESVLDWYPITPLEEGWNEIDDREILCAVWDTTGQISGSLAGVAR